MSGATMTARRGRPASTPEAPVRAGGSSRGAPAARSSSSWSSGWRSTRRAASSLAATGEAQLEARAVEMTNVALGPSWRVPASGCAR